MRSLKMILPLFGLVFMGANCTTIPYQEDTSFLNSAQAGSPEFPATLNDKKCLDVEGREGLCAMRVRSTDALVIKIAPQPYVYAFRLQCDDALNETQNFSVGMNQEFTHTITPDKYHNLPFRAFDCIGSIFPSERNDTVSAKFKVVVALVDSAYTSRETPYILEKKGKKYLVMGEHSLYTHLCEDGICKNFEKKTVFEIKDPSKVTAYSESFSMRYNYYGN